MGAIYAEFLPGLVIFFSILAVGVLLHFLAMLSAWIMTRADEHEQKSQL